MNDVKKRLMVSNLGRTRYADAWDLQHKLFDLRQRRLIGDLLLLTEHEHVYTIGKGGDDNHLLASELQLQSEGIDLFRIDRGGDVTYHGPGQVVGYPIIDLNGHAPDIHRYLRDLEEVIIQTLETFGVDARREESLTGVWVKGEKIAAIGIKVSRWITMHGFALNINTDLQMFERIIPCGIFHKGVTSLQRILGETIPLVDVNSRLASCFGRVFNSEITTTDANELERLVASFDIYLLSPRPLEIQKGRQPV